MDSEKLMEGIAKEMATALKALRTAKTPEEKLIYSEIVKNLAESLGVFLTLVSDMGLYGDDDELIQF